ncbi:MAG: TonB-dependent receptor [Opitutales bacterium]|nr:TonB-dependent receptor [Opitutales bacterium]
MHLLELSCVRAALCPKSLNRGILWRSLRVLFCGAPLLAVSALPAQDRDEIYDMDPFVVAISPDEGYRPLFSNSATLVSVERDRIPFLTSVVTEALLRDVGVDNVADLSGLLPGVSMDTNPAIADEQGQPRLEFRVRGFQARPLYNGFQTGGRMAGTDHIGRVEVSKGPNSVIYGQSSGGGIINIIPKAPSFAGSHATLEGGVGNRSYRRAAFDVGGPLEGDTLGSLGVRLGGGWTEFEREQVFFENRTASLYSAVTWMILENLKFDVTAEYLNQHIVPSRTAAFVSVGSGPDRVTDPFNRDRNDRNFSYTGPYTLNKFETAITTAYLTANLGHGFTARLGGIYSRQTEDSMRYVGAYGLGTAETASSPFEKRDANDRFRGYKIDLLHQGELGGWSVDSLVGYERYHARDNLFAIRTGDAAGNQVSLPVTIPFNRRTVVGDWPVPPPLSQFTNLRIDDTIRTQTENLRFTQILTTPDERGTALWGIARGKGDSSIRNRLAGVTNTLEGSATTYTLGASYRVFESEEFATTLFANYSTSFLIQEGNQQNPADFLGFTNVEDLRNFVNSRSPNPIEPEEGKGFEIGARFNMSEQNLVASVAYFDQTRDNIRRSFFVRESLVPGVDSEAVLATYFLASGKEQIRGVELDLAWSPTPNLSFILGASIADGKVKSNINEPGEEGLDLPRFPERQFSGWVKYTFDVGTVAGLTLGLGANYANATRMLPAFNDRFRLSDSYTDVQALARYEFGTGALRQSISLNVRNLFDSEWTNEANWLSEGRSWRIRYALSW